ncbi:large ribosomal subunit processing factor, putative [Plasmodium relictum]|uniref:Large ribosomal subunit processing factor, putative n=1 Tax=Plasmodium relictum TaxID=85471 RepID=A0A1J1H5F1_PLARL|nr:large ribosomal subunit processing factor, putative [Plasmodium relictum]CRH00134.1 large ribosomal subunit processing factor, putative [Plasmodium relictum]
MINFTSPHTNDPIKKLQNLLNNCLHSIIDVLSNLSYKGEHKELEIESDETSEYSYFINLLKEREKENINKGTEKVKDEKGTNDELESLNKDEETNYFIKPKFEKSIKEEILDRVERMNLILKTIDECIDELPDSLIIEEEKCKEIKMLQKKKDAAKDELKKLYNEYDYIYNYVTYYLRDLIVNIK